MCVPRLGQVAEAGGQVVPETWSRYVFGGEGDRWAVNVGADNDLIEVGLGEQGLEERVGVIAGPNSDVSGLEAIAPEQFILK